MQNLHQFPTLKTFIQFHLEIEISKAFKMPPVIQLSVKHTRQSRILGVKLQFRVDLTKRYVSINRITKQNREKATSSITKRWQAGFGTAPTRCFKRKIITTYRKQKLANSRTATQSSKFSRGQGCIANELQTVTLFQLIGFHRCCSGRQMAKSLK